ncbi:MAG: ArsI/CadI family heavy metal resistance metalloenzyme [Candidatus Eremiobacter antarcticus]|nr:VOC family protein [Candidatus Eremiobacteraeota bacterium]MBC5808849.1 VOC family protein [Candidatus Eremiobacteraeota bacterium]
MKTHLNLSTANLQKSVDFYSVLLNAQPVKHYDDYALFVSEDPGLELALDRTAAVHVSESAHYGVAVESAKDVDEAAARLQMADLTTDVELDDVCCYARQNKVWTTDPDGRRWEIYTVLEETEIRNDATMKCCADPEQPNGCCAA